MSDEPIFPDEEPPLFDHVDFTPRESDVEGLFVAEGDYVNERGERFRITLAAAQDDQGVLNEYASELGIRAEVEPQRRTAEDPPSVDRRLERRLELLRDEDGAERNVAFDIQLVYAPDGNTSATFRFASRRTLNTYTELLSGLTLQTNRSSLVIAIGPDCVGCGS